MSGRSRLPGSSSRRDAARIVAERVVATVAGVAVAVDEVDAAEARLRDGPRAAALPASAGRFEGSRDDRPLLGYDTPTGLTCPYTTPLDVTPRR